jgi:Flp pilus assembly protein TadD
MMERRTEESISAFCRAVGCNPNSATAHSHLSRGFAFAGRDREAIEHGEEAIRLSPLDPEMALFLGAIAVAHFATGQYGQAIERSLEAQRLRPRFQGSRRLLCVSLAQAGRISEARSLLVTIRRGQSNLSFAWIRANYQTPELMECYIEGFRKAGLDGA